MQFQRARTLATLDRAAQQADPPAALGFRPGPGRAHAAWQLLHIAVTEELFATERLVAGTKPQFEELVPRFRGGSTPDDQIPSHEEIRRVLGESREHLVATLRNFSDADLAWIPEGLRERKLTLRDVLCIILWHEAHHQGQAHLTLNLYLNRA
jgi:uncharacterized damage-inducible protein DinB